MVIRQLIRVTGTVQGVGFRPFVYRHAVDLGLAGSVSNDSAGVLIDVTGEPAAIAALLRSIGEHPPPLAVVTGVTVNEARSDLGGTDTVAGFAIRESPHSGEPDVPVSVDTATCSACLAEVDHPEDRRYRYPFTNCTDCGPRYTIVRAVPYDRPATTMAAFTMCDDCEREYHDPADRRFHAQPNACPACGPQLCFRGPEGSPRASGAAALDAAIAAVRAGAIVAVKGLGGYHLAVDATDDSAVAELRRRKHRDDKPFAVMVPDLAVARDLCTVGPAAAALLASPRRPIVLAPRRAGGRPLASSVAPGLAEIGLLLPYSPLHHLLMTALDRPLVLTSGNLADEPIVHTDEDAVTKLGPLVDGLLTHDRPIHIRCDDSVVRTVPEPGRTQVLRRSRGYAPEPMTLPVPTPVHLLAVGAELKSTVAVAKEHTVVASHHIGDLQHLPAYRSFLQAVDHLCHLYGVRPALVVHDLHPDQRSTQFALGLDLPTLGVQHHHAHVASCMVEHQRTRPVLGVAFDGMGYGCDGTAWGGEFLLADLRGAERVGHLRAVALAGGDAAARQPWRIALSWLHAAVGADEALRWAEPIDRRAAALLEVIAAAAPVSLTTSAGRLFDAVAGILGVRTAGTTYEAQAAIELEALARTVERPTLTGPEAALHSGADGTLVLDPAPLVAHVLASHQMGVDRAVIAADFHEVFGHDTAAASVRLAENHGVDTVVLTGGTFQNTRLTEVVAEHLHARGLRTLLHHQVPPNDGGISIGQAAIGAASSG